MTETRELAAQLLIRRYIAPAGGYTYEHAGPDQFPREKPLHSLSSWHRMRVYQSALGIVEYDEEAAYRTWAFGSEEEQKLREQCAFIREHTTPLKPLWTLPPDPLSSGEWDAAREAADEISALGIGPDEPHLCDTCGRWLPCRHCNKET